MVAAVWLEWKRNIAMQHCGADDESKPKTVIAGPQLVVPSRIDYDRYRVRRTGRRRRSTLEDQASNHSRSRHFGLAGRRTTHLHNNDVWKLRQMFPTLAHGVEVSLLQRTRVHNVGSTSYV